MKKMINYEQMSFTGMAFHENYGWFCHSVNNVLCICRINLDSKALVLEKAISVRGVTEISYGKTAYYDGKLVLVPKNTLTILLYDLNAKDIKQLEIKQEYLSDNKATNVFGNAFIHEKYMFLVPGRYHAIVRLDLSSLKTDYYDRWYDDFRFLINNHNKVIFSSESIQIENDILLVFWQGNKIMKFHMYDGSYEILEIGDCESAYSSICYDEKGCWIADKKVPQIYWTENNSKCVSCIKNFPVEFEYKNGIHHIEKIKNGILLFPLCGNMILELNTQTMEVTKFSSLNMEFPNQLEVNFEGYSCYKEKLYMYSQVEKRIFCIDLLNKSICKINCQLSKDDIKKVKKEISKNVEMEKGKIRLEAEDFDLEIYTMKVANNGFERECIVHDKNIGKSIFERIKYNLGKRENE